MSKSTLNVPRIVVTDNNYDDDDDYDDDNEEQATTINVESDSDDEIKRRIRPNSLRFGKNTLFCVTNKLQLTTL